MWKRRGLSFETKLHVYRAVVLPSLLYGSESWTVYSRHLQKLQSFHMRCLRQILHVKLLECLTIAFHFLENSALETGLVVGLESG